MPSKLGIHAILPGETPMVAQQLADAGTHLSTVKAVAAMGWLKEIKEIDETVVTVGRLMHGVHGNINVEGPALDSDLQESAQDVMDSLLPEWEPHRDYVDFWEIINEQDPTGPDGHRRLAEFMSHCIEIADREGYHLGLFSYSLGVPEWEEMRAVVETGVFGQAKAGGHALALHEYAYPMNKWFGEPLPGRPTYPTRGPLACRYRWWYEDFLVPRDEVIPLLLTEVNVAKEMPLLTPHEWITQMKWYDERLREDYYVIGAHLFTLGSASSWENFDFGRFLPLLVDHIASVAEADDPTWPEPGTGPGRGPGEERPAPQPEPSESCAPRTPYSRHYLLLPQNATWAWISACRRYWETFKVTIGFSADDAAYGPGLEERAVTVVNPGAWGDDIEAFFTTYYPGVRYDPINASTPQALESTLNTRVVQGLRYG